MNLSSDTTYNFKWIKYFFSSVKLYVLQKKQNIFMPKNCQKIVMQSFEFKLQHHRGVIQFWADAMEKLKSQTEATFNGFVKVRLAAQRDKLHVLLSALT